MLRCTHHAWLLSTAAVIWCTLAAQPPAAAPLAHRVEPQLLGGAEGDRSDAPADLGLRVTLAALRAAVAADDCPSVDSQVLQRVVDLLENRELTAMLMKPAVVAAVYDEFENLRYLTEAPTMTATTPGLERAHVRRPRISLRTPSSGAVRRRAQGGDTRCAPHATYFDDTGCVCDVGFEADTTGYSCVAIQAATTVERAALLAGFEVPPAAHHAWLQVHGWTNATDPCGADQDRLGWAGVVCVEGYVTELDFGLDFDRSMQFSLLGPEVAKLSHLQRLQLGKTAMFGTMPDALGNLTQLQEVNFGNSAISGTIPAALTRLPRLRYLFLDSTRVSGTLPLTLEGLSQLQELSLQATAVSGSIPASLGALPQLQYLNLQSTWLG
eukprot:SAG25_NODE_1841_length_2274_cov_2.086437_1_plen_381_part_01